MHNFKGLNILLRFCFHCFFYFGLSSNNLLVSLGDGVFYFFTPALTHIANNNCLKILAPCLNEFDFAHTHVVGNLLYFMQNGILKCLPFVTWKSDIISLIRLPYRITDIKKGLTNKRSSISSLILSILKTF